MIPKSLKQEYGEFHLGLDSMSRRRPAHELAGMFKAKTGKSVSKATIQNAVRDIREGRIKPPADTPVETPRIDFSKIVNPVTARMDPFTDEAAEERAKHMNLILAPPVANGVHPETPMKDQMAATKPEADPMDKLLDDIAIVKAAAAQVGGALRLLSVLTQLTRRGMID